MAPLPLILPPMLRRRRSPPSPPRSVPGGNPALACRAVTLTAVITPTRSRLPDFGIAATGCSRAAPVSSQSAAADRHSLANLLAGPPLLTKASSVSPGAAV